MSERPLAPSLRIVQKLPKADLHSHIDGSIPFRELSRIARENHREIVTREGNVLANANAFFRFVMGAGYHTLLSEIIDRFYPILGLMQTEETIREVGRTYVKGLKRDGIIYAEGRFAPHYHTAEGMTLPDVIESMLEGMKAGCEETGVRANLIVAFGREVGIGLAEEVVSQALRYEGRGVVGIDIGGKEEGNPPERFQSAFKLTLGSKLRRTAHAGEGAGSVDQSLRNIRNSIILLRADCIGHAVNLANDRALVSLVRQRGVAIETNPVSNLTLHHVPSLRELGLDRLLSSGVAVSVNSDDPALWPNGSLSENFVAVCNAYDFGLEEVDTLITNSFNTAFASHEEKEALREEYQSARSRLKS